MSGSQEISATLAGFDDHVRELLYFRCSAHVIEDGQGLQVLRDTAGRSRRLGVQRVVQSQHRAVCGVSTAEVRTRPRAEVGIITFRLMNPPPTQVLPEVDV